MLCRLPWRKKREVDRITSIFLVFIACMPWTTLELVADIGRKTDFRFREVVFPDASGAKPEERLGTGLAGSIVPMNTPILTGEGSRVELASETCVLRVGSNSEVELQDRLGIKLSAGACLVQPRGGMVRLKVNSKKSSFTCEGSGVFMIEATTNGGAKVSLLTKNLRVRLAQGNSADLVPGNLLFVLPVKENFGPKVDIDLRLVHSTSLLINGFKQKLEAASEMKSAAFYQGYRIRSRSNAVIGDARTPSNYDVFFMR
jgi:hypothetical protein